VRVILAVVAACAVAAIVLFRPAAPAAMPAESWSAPRASPLPARHTPPPAVVVYVAGEVAHPGVYRLSGEQRVNDAVSRAGGALPNADLVAVNLAARLHDGDEVIVPPKGAAPAPRTRRTAAARPHSTGRRRRPAAATGSIETVDLNHASPAALAALPGIGPALAARIVAFRDLNGPFGDPGELLDVSGITERRFAEIAPYVVAR
jgi:competence protein ComEA